MYAPSNSDGSFQGSRAGTRPDETPQRDKHTVQGGARDEERGRAGVSGRDWVGVDDRWCGLSPPKPVSPKSLAPARKQEQAWISASHRAVRRKQEARAYKGVARAAHRNTTLAWPRTAAGRAMSTNVGATAMPGRKRMDECKQVAREEMRALTRAGIDQRRGTAAADILEHE